MRFIITNLFIIIKRFNTRPHSLDFIGPLYFGGCYLRLFGGALTQIIN